MGATRGDVSAGLIDTHCHVDLYPDPAAVAGLSERLGVRTIAVTNSPFVFDHTRALAERARYLYPAVGLHPQLVASRSHEVGRLVALLDSTRFVGEVGLDYTSIDPEDHRLQRKVFARILGACAEHGDKVITVHSRRAAPDVIDAVGGSFPGKVILHWYSGTVKDLDRALKNGAYISVNTAMISSKKSLALVSRVPADRILTETDGPFITVGQKPAVPSDVNLVVERLAEMWRVDAEEASHVIRSNFDEVIAGDG
ncbi:Qat anti-phage system TatD family nuclease QatD [Tautonia sociabilis]|nr:Qat anti-phage system TatD family nuclease QatD [Tautonia sociabilis]